MARITDARLSERLVLGLGGAGSEMLLGFICMWDDSAEKGEGWRLSHTGEPLPPLLPARGHFKLTSGGCAFKPHLSL